MCGLEPARVWTVQARPILVSLGLFASGFVAAIADLCVVGLDSTGFRHERARFSTACSGPCEHRADPAVEKFSMLRLEPASLWFVKAWIVVSCTGFRAHWPAAACTYTLQNRLLLLCLRSDLSWLVFVGFGFLAPRTSTVLEESLLIRQPAVVIWNDSPELATASPRPRVHWSTSVAANSFVLRLTFIRLRTDSNRLVTFSA